MNIGLVGDSNHSLDAKGRLIIPARFRANLGASFVLCRGMDKNIYAYPEAEWEKFSAKLDGLPIADPDARSFKRHFQGTANVVEVDGQFRIVIPQSLRNYAGIDKDVMLIGQGSRVEIWCTEVYEEVNGIDEESFAEAALRISDKYGV
jgi:MraZ protein